MALGDYHVCAVSTSRTAKCWGMHHIVLHFDSYSFENADTTFGNDFIKGEGYWGKLGYGNTDKIGDTTSSMDNCVELDLGVGFAVSRMSLGASHSCALSTDLTVKCWGLYSFLL